MNQNSVKRIIFITLLLLIIIALAIGIHISGTLRQDQTKQNEIHVSPEGNDDLGKGTKDSPYASVSVAAEKAPGSVIILHEGDYDPIKLGPECSGNEKTSTIIRAAEGEKAVIHAEGETGISLDNVSYITVEGLEIEGGTHGINYESTREAFQPLTDIHIIGCKVHGESMVCEVLMVSVCMLATTSRLFKISPLKNAKYMTANAAPASQ